MRTAESAGRMAAEDDLDLIRAVVAGDQQAFVQFYERYRRTIARFVSRLTWRSDVVEETVNDTMVAVWQGADGFRGGSRVSTWVLGIAYRTALKRLRHVARRPEQELTDRSMPPVATERPDAALARAQGSARIRMALDKLSPEQRAVIELTFYDDCSYQEIAMIVGCPENTVKTRMFHARRRLKHLLGTPELGIVPRRRDHDAS
jgi:RNA polymerase sigma-70 factor (ECF subfamily)